MGDFLARRPTQSSATQQVHMDMEYCLASTFIAVENQAVTVFIDTFVSGDLPGDKRHLASYRCIFLLEVIDGRNMLFRYDENMRWRLWIDIPESDKVIILIHLVTGNLSIPDLAKQAVCHDCSPPVVLKFYLANALQ